MLNNLTNFFNIFRGKMTKTAPTEGDILVLGTRDPRYGGGYKPTAILAEDFLAGAVASSIPWGGITGSIAAQTDLQIALNAKQATLVSGTSIKTVNSTSLLGSGNITVQPTLFSGTNIKTINGNSVLGSGDLTIGGGSLPAWVETNATDLTIWNNGKGNIASNTSFGDSALRTNSTGSDNTAIGLNALSQNTSGVQNTAIGAQSLEFNQTGDSNTAVGYRALIYNTGFANTAIGRTTLLNNTTGTYNIALGSASLFLNTTGSYNTALGGLALLLNTVGERNTAIGYGAGSASAGSDNGNTFIGYQAGNTSNGNGGNVIIGNDSDVRLNTVGGGTCVGNLAIVGSNGVSIGNGATSASFDNSIVIGSLAAATANNQFVVGSSTYNAGAVTTETLSSTKTWSVIINGVAQKILLA